MSHFCPHCGYNLTNDEPIDAGRWRLFPDFALHDGEPVDLNKQELGFLYAVASARPRPVSPELIGARISDGEDPQRLMITIAWQLRKKLGPDVPFTRARNTGYRWTAL